MAAVSELRAELALVAAERDRLRKQLTDVEGMQTETLTLVASESELALTWISSPLSLTVPSSGPGTPFVIVSASSPPSIPVA